MMSCMVGWLLVALLFGQASTCPVPYSDPEAHPLSIVSELGQRLASHAHLPEPAAVDPRLPLPTLQELDAIRKVAQILIMLGEQVIPSILGDSSPQMTHAAASGNIPVEEVPNDSVDDK